MTNNYIRVSVVRTPRGNFEYDVTEDPHRIRVTDRREFFFDELDEVDRRRALADARKEAQRHRGKDGVTLAAWDHPMATDGEDWSGIGRIRG